jgi:hypothetical protein
MGDNIENDVIIKKNGKLIKRKFKKKSD